jgi:hypothetical protein
MSPRASIDYYIGWQPEKTFYGAGISSVKITMDKEEKGLVNNDCRICAGACPQGSIFMA